MKKILALLPLLCMTSKPVNKRNEEHLIHEITLLHTKASVLMAGASTVVYSAVKCIPCLKNSHSVNLSKGIPYGIAMLTFGISNYIINYQTCDLAFEKGQFYKTLGRK